MWEVAIFISVFTYSFSVILQRMVLKEEKSDARAFAVLFQFVVGIFIAIFGIGTQTLKLPSLADFILLSPFFVLMTLTYGVGSVLLYSGLKHVDASRFSILYSLRGVFAVLIVSVFLREPFLGRYILGTLLILAGIVTAHKKAAKLFISKEEWLLIGAALCSGIGNTIDRFLLGRVELYFYVTLAFLLPGIFIFCTSPKTWKPVVRLCKGSQLKPLLLLSFIYAVSAVTFYTALQKAPIAGQVIAINLSSVVVTILLATVFLKERAHLLQKCLAGVMTFLGLLCVS
jgi:drug/metabolite transporter (DMT)-like permease